jgi:2-phospho-L-lactate/phosphoenolpyruvate guanylyltransferase
MTEAAGIWAILPVKELGHAKQRLAELVPARLREALVLAMLEDVLAAIVEAPGLAGLAVVTVDPAASQLALRYGARLIEEGARDGHTGAVAAAARRLAAESASGILTLPGDIPLATPAEIAALLAAHRPAPAFTIAPSHDEQGSNAVLLSPPEAVPLRFGDNSFFPHLRAAEERGILPTVLRLPGIALDIDNPQDLRRFARVERDTRTRSLVLADGILEARGAAIGGRAG